MEKVTLKRIMLASVGFVIVLFSLLCLAFNLVRLDLMGGFEFSGSGVDNIKYAENGFDLLGGNSKITLLLANLSEYIAMLKVPDETEVAINTYEWMNVFAQVLNILILVISSILIVLTVLWFFFDKKKEDLYALVIVGTVLGALYLVEGIVLTTVTKLEMEQMAKELLKLLTEEMGAVEVPISIADMSSKEICTFAYIPMIVLAVGQFAFWMVNYLMQEKGDNAETEEVEGICASNPAAGKEEAAFTLSNKGGVAFLENRKDEYFTLLMKYKDLYDAGVLTKEEFLQQKRLCLSINSMYALYNFGILNKKGLLTNEEFEAEKKKLIMSE